MPVLILSFFRLVSCRVYDPGWVESPAFSVLLLHSFSCVPAFPQAHLHLTSRRGAK